MGSRLDSFRMISYTSENPYMTISKYGIQFSKSTIELLNAPAFVHIFIDEEKKQFAIQPCEYDGSAFPFVKEPTGGKQTLARWNNTTLVSVFSRIVGKDFKAKAARANGSYFNDENLIIFDLTDLQPTAKPRNTKKSSDSQKSEED